MDSRASIVGAQMRAAREAAGVSLAALAAQIHYSKSVLAYYETGERTPTPEVISWYEKRFGGIQDPVTTLFNLGKADVERRSFLRVGYSAALSVSVLLPGGLDPATSAARRENGARRIGETEVEAVRDVMQLFSQMDQRLGVGMDGGPWPSTWRTKCLVTSMGHSPTRQCVAICSLRLAN